MASSNSAKHQLAEGIAQLESQSSSPSSPLELLALLPELELLQAALQRAHTLPLPSRRLISSFELMWRLLQHRPEGVPIRGLRDLLFCVVLAVSEVTRAVSAAAAYEESVTLNEEYDALLGEERLTQLSEDPELPGMSGAEVVAAWERVLLELCERDKFQAQTQSGGSMWNLASDLKREAIIPAEVAHFTDSFTSIELRNKFGLMLRQDSKTRQHRQTLRNLDLSQETLSVFLAVCEHVSAARTALDLAFALAPVTWSEWWAAALFPKFLYGSRAGTLQCEFCERLRDSDEASVLGRFLDVKQSRDALLQRILKGNAAGAQLINATAVYAFPAASAARVVSLKEHPRVPLAAESGMSSIDWAINRDSIEATVCQSAHQPKSGPPIEFNFKIDFTDVTQVELLSNSQTEELACKLTTSCAPTVDGKPLRPTKLGSANGRGWSVVGDANLAALDNQKWVVLFICDISSDLIDLGAIFDERARHFPNLTRAISTHYTHQHPSKRYLKYISKLVQPPVEVDLSDEDVGAESSESELESDWPARVGASAQTTPESTATKRKATTSAEDDETRSKRMRKDDFEADSGSSDVEEGSETGSSSSEESEPWWAPLYSLEEERKMVARRVEHRNRCRSPSL